MIWRHFCNKCGGEYLLWRVRAYAYYCPKCQREVRVQCGFCGALEVIGELLEHEMCRKCQLLRIREANVPQRLGT
jgi:hypothetical protein